jgi:hypothetical protein
VDWGWAPLENYRKEHWKYVDLPLDFSYDTGKPVLLNAFSQYEYVDSIKNRLPENKLIYANSKNGYGFYAHMIDILGSEIDEIESDEKSSYRRTLSYHKTNNNILASYKLQINHELIENFIKNEMFYGIYSSVSFGKNKEIYWDNASLYEPDRSLFQKYVPIIKEISNSGWEPIPYATIDNPNMKIERYGSIHNNLYFTVDNTGLYVQNGTFIIDLSKQGYNNNNIATVNITELLSKNWIMNKVLDGKVSFNISLKPGDISVYKIQ